MKKDDLSSTIPIDSALEIEIATERLLQASGKLEALSLRMREVRKVYRFLSEAWDYVEVRDGTLAVDPCVRRQLSAMQVDFNSIPDAECLMKLFREYAVLECELRKCTAQLRIVAPHLDH